MGFVTPDPQRDEHEPVAVYGTEYEQFEDRVVASLAAAAVGDAFGGATEGWSAEAIRERHGGPVTGIVGPFLPDWRTARPIAPYHKGDGHITDDTLMIHAMVDVYTKRRAHLDAYAVADDLVPLMIGTPRWIPELEAEALLLQRVFLAEKWLVARLHYGHNDPREAGVGNVVNCGAAMYMAPVGVVNAADPERAYAEAIDIAGAHQSSYGREAAGVLAAAVAAAFVPGTTPREVVQTCCALAHDGTRDAIAAVLDSGVDGIDHLAAIPLLRGTVEPFDSVGPEYRQPGPDARRPSRTRSIEELPVALGFVLAADGRVRDAVLGGVNYGRDADSIASMAGAISGALSGLAAVPADWRARVATASRTDIEEPGRRLAAIAREIAASDAAAADQVRLHRAALLGGPTA